MEKDIIALIQQLNSTEYVKKFYTDYTINYGADIVYIYFGTDQLDFDYCLWKCESIWCYSKLDNSYIPYKLKDQDDENKILICWNESYTDIRKVYEGFVSEEKTDI